MFSQMYLFLCTNQLVAEQETLIRSKLRTDKSCSMLLKVRFSAVLYSHVHYKIDQNSLKRIKIPPSPSQKKKKKIL